MYSDSTLDGRQTGGFVVVNVDATQFRSRFAVCESDAGESVFSELEHARLVCRDLRRRSGNRELYVYALADVTQGLPH